MQFLVFPFFGRQDAHLKRLGHGGGCVLDVELSVDVGDMGGYGGGADIELFRDVPLQQSLTLGAPFLPITNNCFIATDRYRCTQIFAVPANGVLFYHEGQGDT